MTGRFPKADAQFSRDLVLLGRARLAQYETLTREQLHQSLQAAVLAANTGVSVEAVLAGQVHACGPKRKSAERRKLRK